MKDIKKSTLIEIALKNGCKTVKDYAIFLKENGSKEIEKIVSKKEITQLSLLR